MSAHDAAVEAMAAAMCFGHGPSPCHGCKARVRSAIAALVRSEAVRAALVERLELVYYPTIAADGADAILAALRPDDEGGAG